MTVKAVELRTGRQFFGDVFRLIWEYRAYSLAIVLVTGLQEVAALWPVSVLGEFVDRLGAGDVGNVAWALMGVSLLHPAVVRGNAVLRHKMFYETDFKKRVELTLRLRARGGEVDLEEAGAANSRIASAVSGMTNATYHVLGSFTPVVIKIVVVAASLVAYNRLLGVVYVGSLAVPLAMTFAFNLMLRVLWDAQFSTTARAEGVVMKTLTGVLSAEQERRFRSVMMERKRILVELVARNQIFLYLREAMLVGSQFLVVFIALGMRNQLGLTPGDFTRLVGYTAQVGVAFINAAACLDAIVSHSRAYHVYARASGY